ncbi:hypothetical protein SDC9_98219 [bioreactor metagenome]|uniref:DUF4440 domain-containing protein n=1 Tax=bioreactor metagenome TaxID=1076179 RepID=A0A645AE75_9ZZZZ
MKMDEQQIFELYRAVNQAMVAKDIDKLDRILADGMHLVHMTGYDQTKDEWFAQIRSEQMRYYSTKEENIKDLKIEGNKASFIGQSRVDARIYGSRNTWRLLVKNFFEKRNGEWIIVRQEASTY